MATFTTGQTLSLTLDYDDYVQFSGSGNMTVTPYTGSSWQTYLTGNQVIGPFKTQSTTVSISCTSDGTYTQQSQVGVNNRAYFNGTGTALVDPVTQQTINLGGVVAKVFVGTGGTSSGTGTTIQNSTNPVGTYTTKLKFWQSVRDDLGSVIDIPNSKLIIPAGYSECRLTYSLAWGYLTWTAGETVAVNDVRIPSTYASYIYVATSITTGVTGGTEPTWPTTPGNTIADGGVTWTCRSTVWATGWRGARVKTPGNVLYGNVRQISCGDGTTTNINYVSPWLAITSGVSVSPDSIQIGDSISIYPSQTSGQPMTCGADGQSSWVQLEVR